MDVFTILKNKFLGIALACVLCVPTITLSMQLDMQQEKPDYGYSANASLLGLGSQFATPYVLHKAGIDIEESYVGIASKGFAIPTVSYLAWEAWNWLGDKLYSHNLSQKEQKECAQEKQLIRKDLRKNIITGGISNVIGTALVAGVKHLRKSNNNDTQASRWNKVLWTGLEMGAQMAAAVAVNLTWDTLFGAKKQAPIVDQKPAKENNQQGAAASNPAAKPQKQKTPKLQKKNPVGPIQHWK